MILKETKLTIDDLIQSFNDNISDNKFIWFSETLLELTFDDDSIAESEGNYLYNMCLDIFNRNNDRFYPNENEDYSKDIMYKNLLEYCGLNVDYGVSYRQAWFDYYSDERLINDDKTMDWLLNDFMKDYGEK